MFKNDQIEVVGPKLLNALYLMDFRNIFTRFTACTSIQNGRINKWFWGSWLDCKD